jgi:hypothetical protein
MDFTTAQGDSDMSNPHTGHATVTPRHDRLISEWVHDPYHSKQKLQEPSLCPGCGAVYHDGRWQWIAPETGTREVLCPACHRIQDQCPAGFLTLSGEFLTLHLDDISHLAHNVEQREKAEHPLKRCMATRQQADGSIEMTYTDPQLARAVGEAIHAAYRGELNYHYQENEYLLRVSWHR